MNESTTTKLSQRQIHKRYKRRVLLDVQECFSEETIEADIREELFQEFGFLPEYNCSSTFSCTVSEECWGKDVGASPNTRPIDTLGYNRDRYPNATRRRIRKSLRFTGDTPQQSIERAFFREMLYRAGFYSWEPTSSLRELDSLRDYSVVCTLHDFMGPDVSVRNIYSSTCTTCGLAEESYYVWMMVTEESAGMA